MEDVTFRLFLYFFGKHLPFFLFPVAHITPETLAELLFLPHSHIHALPLLNSWTLLRDKARRFMWECASPVSFVVNMCLVDGEWIQRAAYQFGVCCILKFEQEFGLKCPFMHVFVCVYLCSFTHLQFWGQTVSSKFYKMCMAVGVCTRAHTYTHTIWKHLHRAG